MFRPAVFAGADFVGNEGLERDFWRALSAGDDSAVSKCLAAGVSADSVSSTGVCAVSHAAHYGKSRVLGVLLAAGANPDGTKDDRPLARAMSGTAFGSGTAQMLLEAGADPNVGMVCGGSGLARAVELGLPDLVDAFLGAGADPDGRGDDGVTALEKVAQADAGSGRHIERMAGSLLSHGAKPWHFSTDGTMTGALAKAARNGNTAFLGECERAGLFAGSSGGVVAARALGAACHGMSLEVRSGDDEMARRAVSMLLSRGVRPEGDCLVWVAAAGDGAVGVLGDLLSAGADIGARDHAGRSALHAACCRYEGAVKTVGALLEAGADVDSKDSEGMTALAAVCAKPEPNAGLGNLKMADESRDLIGILLGAGADMEALDRNGRSPLGLAVMFKREGSAVELVRRGARCEGALLRMAKRAFGGGMLDAALDEAELSRSLRRASLAAVGRASP